MARVVIPKGGSASYITLGTFLHDAAHMHMKMFGIYGNV